MAEAEAEDLGGAVPLEDVRRFLGDWARELAVGTPILRGLARLAEVEPNARLKGVIVAMRGAVERGDSLWDEMRRHPEAFDERVIDAMSEGELEGTMDVTLKRLLEGEEGEAEAAVESGEPPVSVIAVAEFTRGLAQMIAEGQSLVRSMAALEEREADARLREIIGAVNREVQAGHTLSDALKKFPGVFDEAYVDAVRLGEINSNLDQSLFGLAHIDDYLSFDEALRFLGTSKATLYRLLSQKSLEGLKVGRQWRFRKADLVAYMERKPSGVSGAGRPELDRELEALQVLAGSEAPAQPQGDEEKVLALANAIIAQAIQSGASDLHLESARLDGQGCLLVRNRVDGVLHEVRRIPSTLEKPLFERLKAMADLSLDERALPQDGRILISYKEQNFDLRVSFSPSSFGGSMVLRILAQNSMVASLEQMGLEDGVRERLQAWMARPNGLILLAGMTGSGKTSTFYALLSSQARPEIKTLTIEDPVESAIPYATQVWVNARAGLTFASALRAFLRQDPDIIGLGELRDIESASVVAQAATTGHLVVATLHARSAVEGISRLLDLKLPAFVAADATIGVAAQMLIRRLCPECKAPAEPNDPLLQALSEASGEDASTWGGSGAWARAVGCAACRRTGYRGRAVLIEVLEINQEIASALSRGEGREEIERLAVAGGMQSFASQAARRAARGETSIEEVLRALFLGTP